MKKKKLERVGKQFFYCTIYFCLVEKKMQVRKQSTVDDNKK